MPPCSASPVVVALISNASRLCVRPWRFFPCPGSTDRAPPVSVLGSVRRAVPGPTVEQRCRPCLSAATATRRPALQFLYSGQGCFLLDTGFPARQPCPGFPSPADDHLQKMLVGLGRTQPVTSAHPYRYWWNPAGVEGSTAGTSLSTIAWPFPRWSERDSAATAIAREWSHLLFDHVAQTSRARVVRRPNLICQPEGRDSAASGTAGRAGNIEP